MSRSLRALTTVLLLVLSIACDLAGNAAQATPLIDRTIIVQPIDVCDSTTLACAPVNLLAMEAVTQQIYAQAGLGVTFLAASNLYDTAYLTPFVNVAGDPLDQAHQLLRLPNSARAADPTVLDVYFVNTLVRSDGGTIHGFGLIGSNGAIVDSGAALDSMAHEIGHNLGLTHVDSIPGMQNNLMQSVGRTLPATVADVSLDGLSGTDRLTGSILPSPLGTGQIGQARQPLFTVGLLGFKSSQVTSCTTLIEGCTFSLQGLGTSGSSADSLATLRIRFLHASDVVGAGDFRSINCSATPSTLALSNGGIEFDYVLPAGCLGSGDAGHFDLSYPEDPAGCSLCGRPDIYTPPFSFEFDATGGITSTALFDATSQSVSSQNPVSLGFVGSPVRGIGTDVPYDPLAIDIDTSAAVPTPEPATFALLASGLCLLVLRRKRRTEFGPQRGL